MTKQIYLIDDDVDICRLAAVSFQALSEHVLSTFQDGAALVAQVAEQMPDLLILDVMMPGQSGPELLSALQQKFGETLAPVVFLTAKVQPEEVAQLKQLGVRDVLAKPFSPNQLLEQVDRLLV